MAKQINKESRNLSAMIIKTRVTQLRVTQTKGKIVYFVESRKWHEAFQ